MSRVAILDLDGTLVDTNYQHALAWFRAFREHQLVLPTWRIHRAIGMGGDNLVEHLAGAEVEERLGEDIRKAEARYYGDLIGEVEPLEGAHDLLVELKQRGLTVVLASSAKEEEVDHYLELLDARRLVDGWTTSADVEATKPEPDLVYAALEKSGMTIGTMVGDTPWDVIAAKRAGIATVCLRTGGFAPEELKEAGAVAVFESVIALREHLDETPLGEH